MPVNWEQLHGTLRDVRNGLAERSIEVRKAQDRVLGAMEKYAGDPHLPERLGLAVSTIDPDLRCAAPALGALNAAQSPSAAAGSVTLIAADGSQVTPDRHDRILFGVINIGTVVLRLKSGQAPTVQTDTELLYGERLFGRTGSLMSEGDIALLRDRAERSTLLRLVRGAGPTSIALTDGPLELWGAKDTSDPRAFEDALNEYLNVLTDLHKLGCTIAGYVDKPAADLMVRLMEVAEAGPVDLSNLRYFRPFREVSDRWLFSQILQPGQRSAIFRLQSSSSRRYTGDLSIHFFYVNVGTQQHAAIARVEVPKWVAMNSESVGTLHAALLEQCAILGARPYPYILHRAHETARVTPQERDELGLQLMQGLLDSDQEIEDTSGKLAAKASSNVKGRY